MAKQLNYQDHKEALLEALQDSSAQSRVKFVAELKEKGITFPSNYDTGTEWLINLRQDADDHGKGWLSKTKGKEEGGKKQGATVQHKAKSGLSLQQQTMIGAMADMQGTDAAEIEAAYNDFAKADETLSSLKEALEAAQQQYDEAVRAAFFRFIGEQGRAHAEGQ
ncbi:hypothetical protein [Pseudomonas sp. MS15a(2019)]|uniref:hypothetical protein n=1 Tax=Pseudomonas sp. MS15a(2019) TaxID=2579938 RepID=UPI001565B594|nr:hypothetical protein [Pseudomonas sp. MS15a(2019)]NRH40641.1 hypothetical protein [Pseudomonas sp. MS15a(2019)]